MESRENLGDQRPIHNDPVVNQDPSHVLSANEQSEVMKDIIQVFIRFCSYT